VTPGNKAALDALVEEIMPLLPALSNKTATLLRREFVRDIVRGWAHRWMETVEAHSYLDMMMAELAPNPAELRHRYDQYLVDSLAHEIAREGRERGVVELVDCGKQLHHGMPVYESHIRITALRTEAKR
jgi:hypothetical protein